MGTTIQVARPGGSPGEGMSKHFYNGRWHRSSLETIPYRLKNFGSRRACAEACRAHPCDTPRLPWLLAALAGKHSACHCDLFHGDVLVEEFVRHTGGRQGPVTLGVPWTTRGFLEGRWTTRARL